MVRTTYAPAYEVRRTHSRWSKKSSARQWNPGDRLRIPCLKSSRILLRLDQRSNFRQYRCRNHSGDCHPCMGEHDARSQQSRPKRNTGLDGARPDPTACQLLRERTAGGKTSLRTAFANFANSRSHCWPQLYLLESMSPIVAIGDPHHLQRLSRMLVRRTLRLLRRTLP